MPQTISPEIAGMPRAKRQAEARKKTDQAPHHRFRLALLKQPCGDGSKTIIYYYIIYIYIHILGNTHPLATYFRVHIPVLEF
jgi:hypothetical protein